MRLCAHIFREVVDLSFSRRSRGDGPTFSVRLWIFLLRDSRTLTEPTPDPTRGNRQGQFHEFTGDLTSNVNSHYLSRSQWLQLSNPIARRRIQGGMQRVSSEARDPIDHARPFVGASQCRSWSHCVVLGAILWGFIAKK